MLDLLADSPLLLLFVVAAVGVLVGRIRVAGFSLGISAVLAYALEQSEEETAPNTGYAAVFPIAMITKIVLAQVLVVALA